MDLPAPARHTWASRSVLLVLLVLATIACSRYHENVPNVQGAKAVAPQSASIATAAAKPQRFVLVSAHPAQYQGQLAITLEFSRALVGT